MKSVCQFPSLIYMPLHLSRGRASLKFTYDHSFYIIVNSSLGMIPSMRLQYSLAFLEAESKKKKKSLAKTLSKSEDFPWIVFILNFYFLWTLAQCDHQQTTGSPPTMSQKDSHKPNAALRGLNENLSQDVGTSLEFQRLRACPYGAGGMDLSPGGRRKIARALRVEAW